VIARDRWRRWQSICKRLLTRDERGGSRPTWQTVPMSAFGGKADMTWTCADVCFSNRPIGVKRFQAIHHCGLDVTRGLVLLYGLGARALPSWDPRTRWNNLLSDLSVKRTVGPSRHANSPHPSSRQGHYFTAWWSSSFLLSHWILSGLMPLQLLWSI
jgi:hypothetical protein